MHNYSTETKERTSAVLVLVALAILLTFIVSAMGARWGWKPPFWLEIPSPFGWFGICYSVMNKWGWRWKWVRMIGLSTVPDLNGVWIAHLKTSHDGFRNRKQLELTIRQTWTKILIDGRSDQSSSKSYAAAMAFDGIQPVLVYLYRNQPRASASPTMEAHTGCAEVDIQSDCLQGYYYSGRGRSTHGEFDAIRRDS